MPVVDSRAPIRGISKSSLWNAWKEVRRELRNSSVRDVIDFLDYDVDPEIWINALLQHVRSGRYEPNPPNRFTLGKGNGFSRTMSLPSIPDLTLYRAIVDYIYRKIRFREHKHVYFRRPFLEQAQREAQAEAEAEIKEAGQYGRGARAYLNWLKYDQYRKHLLLKNIYPFLVVTDIANFFDSLLHSHVDEALRGIRIPPRMTGLLFFLLERLSIRQDYSASLGISLPVDEFDCSRTLAHIVLFAHDAEIVSLAGEDAYVRWMDDQNIGVQSRAEGLRMLAEAGKSLSRLHLAPNSKKSRVLPLSEARRHFHLDLNSTLDRAERAWKRDPVTRRARRDLGAAIRRVWARARAHEGVGEFDKILKRIYLFAGRTNARFLRRRAAQDIFEQPGSAVRICDYMRNSGSALEYLNFVEDSLNSTEQVYENVNVVLVESLLRLEADGFESQRIRAVASKLLRGELRIPGGAQCRAVAPLLLLRFGDRRSLPLLTTCLTKPRKELSFPFSRSVAVVLASYGATEFRLLRRIASRLLHNHLSSVVLLVERIRDYEIVPDRYKNRLRLRMDSMKGTPYIDMRSILTARLLLLNSKAPVRHWVGSWVESLRPENLSRFDRSVLSRLVGGIGAVRGGSPAEAGASRRTARYKLAASSQLVKVRIKAARVGGPG